MTRSDWWISGILPLAGLQLALFVVLEARPGPVAVPLWMWGRPVLTGRRRCCSRVRLSRRSAAVRP